MVEITPLPEFGRGSPSRKQARRVRLKVTFDCMAAFQNFAKTISSVYEDELDQKRIFMCRGLDFCERQSDDADHTALVHRVALKVRNGDLPDDEQYEFRMSDECEARLAAFFDAFDVFDDKNAALRTILEIAKLHV
ncbi:MAG: hypothetical protein AAFX52_11900 [Pseudomonadota bacterium]